MRLYKLTGMRGKIECATTKTAVANAALEGKLIIQVDTPNSKRTVEVFNNMLADAYANGVKAGREEATESQ